MTALMFENWFTNCFIPEVKMYYKRENIPFNVLLVLDNAPGHPTFLKDFDERVKVEFFPPNTTALIQPMDQGVIATFKAHYLKKAFAQASKIVIERDISVSEFWKKYSIHDCIVNSGIAWENVAKFNTCLVGCWKALLGDSSQNTKGSVAFEVEEVAARIIDEAHRLGVDIGMVEIDEFIDEDDTIMSTSDLLQYDSLDEVDDSDSGPELESPQKAFNSKGLADARANAT